MYIKKVRHKNKKNGIEYYTYKIIESIRTEQGPRTKDILNLGTKFELPQEQWKELANRIEEIVTGQERLFEHPAEVEKLAGKYATKIIRRQSEFIPVKKELPTSPDYQTVDVNSIENEEARTIGAEHVVYETMKKLELREKLIELGFTKPQVEVSLGVIAGRLIAPGSERATHLWLQNISGIDELMNTDFSMLSQDRVYKASDMLLMEKEELEKHLTLKERNLFNLKEQIILYDLTNTFFEGTGKYNSKARYGHSKEKRTDCPLVTLGLVLDGEGFPKKSEVFAGNVSEPKTLESMLNVLSGEKSFDKPIVIIDAGIATEPNIQWLKEHQYDYLVPSRCKKKDVPETLDMVTVKKDKNVLVRVALVKKDEAGDEVELYCHSSSKEGIEKSIKSLFQQRFERELKNALNSLYKKHGTKKYEKVIERIGRLKEKFKRVAYRYEITVTKDSDTNNVLSINWSQKETDSPNGVYYLRTNRTDLNEKQIWDIYNMLTDVEDAFRCMKSDLGLRPINHQIETRVDGHLFITVLAYHILHAIRLSLRQHGILHSWATIRTFLSTHVRISTILKTKGGKVLRIRKTSKPELFHKDIYNALNISCFPAQTLKSIL